MILSEHDITAMIGARPTAAHPPATGYSIDSRTLRAGDLFFAVRGPRFDGHDFIEASLRLGAAAAVASRQWLAANRTTTAVYGVEDPSQALVDLARGARRRWGKPVIAVTGSNGKTTTKEIISALLAVRYQVARSAGNLNNELGLPLSLLRFEDQAGIGVVELGMNHAGEIRRLAAIAGPTVGVVTNVGTAHLEFFDSIEGVALAKRELIESLGVPGVAVLNADDGRVRSFSEAHPGRSVFFGTDQPADFRAGDIELRGARGAVFHLRRRGESGTVPFVSPLVGRHNVRNVVAAISVAALFDIEPVELTGPVSRLTAATLRGEVLEQGGVLILKDCYNANPPAMSAMLEVLRQTPARRRIAVLGEMRELGMEAKRLHRQVGREAVEAGVDLLIGVRGDAREIVAEARVLGCPADRLRYFEDPQQVGQWLASNLRSGDVVLFKGSRAVGLEGALPPIERALGAGEALLQRVSDQQ
jgi:UDP-N-acetylmuramoyl-tripeptide--D-alanyl-D-alanine ligase